MYELLISGGVNNATEVSPEHVLQLPVYNHLQDGKVEVMVWFMSGYDIMHENDHHRDVWPPLPGAFVECKAHKYVAIIEEIKS